MERKKIGTLYAKDWMEIRKSRRVVLTMIFVPLVFVCSLPLITMVSAMYLPEGDVAGDTALARFVELFPQDGFPEGLDLRGKYIYAMLIYILAPFFLMIPVMVSSVVAANSFAGEKERRTLEGLLYTPVTERELIVSKILVSFSAATGVSLFCTLVYAALVNIYSLDLMGAMIFPTGSWLVLIFWLTPALSFLTLSLIVWVSQRASSVLEAQQISSVVVLPLLGLMITQSMGLLLVDTFIVFLMGLVALILDVLLFRKIIRGFSREAMVARMT